MYVKIKEQIKDAMKNKDTEKRDVLKMVVGKAKSIIKEKNPTANSEDIPDDVMIQAIQKEIKQLIQTKDSLVGREESELYVATVKKMVLLEEYLPKMMSKEEVEAAVAEILTAGDYPNFGLKMKAVMCALKGKADNKVIKEVVEQYK